MPVYNNNGYKPMPMFDAMQNQLGATSPQRMVVNLAQDHRLGLSKMSSREKQRDFQYKRPYELLKSEERILDHLAYKKSQDSNHFPLNTAKFTIDPEKTIPLLTKTF